MLHVTFPFGTWSFFIFLFIIPELSSEKQIYKQRLLVISVLLFVGCVIYYFFNPKEVVFFPQCPFHTITGLDCPGCGSQRAIHSLLHFQFKEAFFSNPLLIFSIPYILTGIYFEYFGGKKKYPQIRKILFGSKAIIVIFFIIIFFSIGRNIF